MTPITTFKPTLMQRLLGRNYNFDIKDKLVLAIIIFFYGIWTFRSWFGYAILNLDTDNNLYWGVTKILWIPFTLSLGYLIFKKDYIRQLGLQKVEYNDFKYIFLGLFVVLFYIFAPSLFGAYDLDFANWHVNFSLNDWFSSIIIIAFGEELLFRGFIFSWLNTRFNNWIAVVGSSFLFSLIHYCWWVFAGIATFDAGFSVFVTGLILGYFRLKSDSIYVTTLIHFIFNLILTGFGF